MASLDLGLASTEIPADMATKLRTNVGQDYITHNFQKHLEGYYNKATPTDQAKCLELVTALHLGEGLAPQYTTHPPYTSKIPKDIRRCKSAMAKIGSTDKDGIQAFSTSYSRDYTSKLTPTVVAHRPSTSQGYATTNDKRGPIGMTLYTEDFGNKPINLCDPIRSGTSSGERNNNPHPKQAFMTWRFPSHGRKKYVRQLTCNEPLTKEKINYIHRRMCCSTYQKDYLGIPQGFQMKSAYDLPPDWKRNVVYSVETSNRMAYQNPKGVPELALPSTRYGSNRTKNKAAVGTIPMINRCLLDLKTKTTYDRHFNENASAVTQQIRDVSRDINIDALEKFYNTSLGKEKEIVGKMLHSLKPDRYQQPRCHTASQGRKSRTPGPHSPVATATTPSHQLLEQDQPIGGPISTQHLVPA
ncbi:testis-expressed protein 26-like [Liolophura sinensis]|uniref:testis-expressed protein 26-like n=1 Tax=Liolophura sinensis TaxID=3198878 RepID=UPI003157F3BF